MGKYYREHWVGIATSIIAMFIFAFILFKPYVDAQDTLLNDRIYRQDTLFNNRLDQEIVSLASKLDELIQIEILQNELLQGEYER